MRPVHWRAVNGFSNFYPGWGGEDDDLFHRVRQVLTIYMALAPLLIYIFIYNI